MEWYNILIICISAFSLLVSFLAWRDKRSNKSDTSLEEIKNKLNCAQAKILVLEERINTDIKNTEHSLDRIANKLELIQQRIQND